jgi:hypothetical protein
MVLLIEAGFLLQFRETCSQKRRSRMHRQRKLGESVDLTCAGLLEPDEWRLQQVQATVTH